MPKHQNTRVWFFAALCVAHAASAQTLFHRYRLLQTEEVPRQDEADKARSARITRDFYRLFSGAQSHYLKLTETELHTLLAAAVEAGDFSESMATIKYAQMDLAALVSRKQASDQDYRSVYDALLQHRQFAQARLLYSEHPGQGMAPTPDIVDRVGSPHADQTVYVVADKGARFVRKMLAMPQTGIVVVAQPGCHFTVDAAQAVHGDPALSALFRDHSIWLAPAQHPLNADEFRQWNSVFPEAALLLSERNSAWPVIDRWSTPTFYIFQQGKLVKEVLGWPPTGGWATFANALRQIGLNPPSTLSTAANGVRTEVAVNVAEQATQTAIDRGTAPIRSRADLDAYLRATPLRYSPLRFLSVRRRALFLNGLTFDQSGTQTVPIAQLQGLTTTQAYKLLSLFGWQSEIRSVRGLA